MTHRLKRFAHLALVALLAVGLVGCSSSGSNDDDNGGGPPEEDTTPPPVPSNLEAVSGDSEVELSWSSVSASDLEGYNVYRSTSSIGSLSGLTPINGSPLSQASFTDSDVSNGTLYYYRVSAVDDSDNESGGSSEVEVTPFPTPPDRP
jgi:TolB protein